MASFNVFYNGGVATKTLIFRDKLYFEMCPERSVPPLPSIAEQVYFNHEELFCDEVFAEIIDDLTSIEDEEELLSVLETLSQYERLKSIDELDLTVRTRNVLLRAGLTTTEQLSSMSDTELLGVKYFNEKCLKEVREKLRSLKEDNDE